MDLNFGKLFQEKRRAKGLTLEVIASKIGVTKSYLSQVENGIRRPSESIARKLGEVLKEEEIETWIFIATQAPLIQKIRRQYPTQFDSLFRERKTISKVYKTIIEAKRKSNRGG
jgi:transcriptional regulator with XRE-family HTH domain